MGKLATVFREMVEQSQFLGGDRVVHRLKHGARLSVVADGAQRRLTIGRMGAKVGDVEERTFVRHCGVPDDAVRDPVEGQHEQLFAGRGPWYWLTYAWREGEHG